MAGENYRYARQHLELAHWDVEAETTISREPSNAELLKLLDALHADLTGVNTQEYEQSLSDRYWNS